MIPDQVKAGFARLLSYMKSDWTLKDYPVRYDQYSDDPDDPQRWCARVINWWGLVGIGATKAEAHEDLCDSFAAAMEEREALPRPGTDVPIEFASDDELRRYWGVTSRIVSEVLGFDPQGIFISDGTSLWDFADEQGVAEYQKQIEALFGQDITHIESGNLAEIARFISESM